VTTSILITGANGFVGHQLGSTMAQSGYKVVGAVRTTENLEKGVSSILVPSIDESTSWTEALQGIDTVIHLAARVHVMTETASNPLAEFRHVNVAGTLNLAQQAVSARVRRFVYISSIKVNGETTDGRSSFTPADTPNPQDPYGVSKWEAEQALWGLAASTGLEVVVIRPPLIYGPMVKGNFRTLMELLKRRWPLPLGLIQNHRSFVGLTNLVSFIVQCSLQAAAANETFLISDGEDLSTSELLRRLGHAMGSKPVLLPVPPRLLQIAASATGRDTLATRLLGSLQVNASKARTMLKWTPPMSVDAELQRTADSFLNT